MSNNIKSLTVAQLKEMATNKGITVKSRDTKDVLIKNIQNHKEKPVKKKNYKGEY